MLELSGVYLAYFSRNGKDFYKNTWSWRAEVENVVTTSELPVFPSWYYCMLLVSDPLTSKAHTVTSCTKV